MLPMPLVALLMTLGGTVSAVTGLTVLFGPWALVAGGVVIAGVGAFLMPVAEPVQVLEAPYDETEAR